MQRIVQRSLGLVTASLVFAALASCGSHAPNWTFKDAGGDLRAMSDYQGGVTVLAFTNSWCDSCHYAAMFLQEIQQRFADQGVRVVYVSSWEHGDPGAYLNENGYTYGLMLNGTELAQQYSVTRLPTFVVIGVNGKVIYRHNGLSKGTPAKITKVVEKHMRKHGLGAFAKHNS